MTLKKTHLIMLAALAAAALVSCKKDKVEEALPYLNGSLKISGIDNYIKYLPDPEAPDDEKKFKKYKLTVTGAEHPEGGSVGYRWKVTPGMKEYETTKKEGEDGDGSFTWGYKDTMATFTISSVAFAANYTSINATKYVTMVKSGPDGSIQNAGYPEKYIPALDTKVTEGDNYIVYDGIPYFTFKGKDGKTWMQQNLAYKGTETKAAGAAYDNADAMSDILGRYYTWEEATKGETASAKGHIRGICPEGWHIPSDAEWTALANATMASLEKEWEPFGEKVIWTRKDTKISREFMAGEPVEESDSDAQFGKTSGSATFNKETEMWTYYSSVGDPDNRSGISALPIGYAQKSNDKWTFHSAYEYAIFWTSDKDENGMGLCRVIHKSSPDVYLEAHDTRSFAAAVRCIKD